ncbi:hypothetical protein ACGFJC_37700 [Nonomuraea fuscirosea]|uniref:hypothetical protein n=1 Tax=Nonomuraea fuscirosea TaxID=1291556 RepID=UPI00341B51B5
MRVPLAVLAAVMILFLPAQADAAERRRVLATDVVEYACKAGSETQNVKVRITLTMPASTAVDDQLSIGWQGAYEGTALKAPLAGLDDGTKLYAYAGISKYPGLTSATGVGTLEAITPGADITLPATRVEVLTTPNKAGTGVVRPGAINFGTTPTSPAIRCEVRNRAALTTYTLKVPTSGQDDEPDPDATDGESPEPTETETPTETPAETPEETPTGGVATGAGGEAGPDGRMVVAAGLVITMAALAGLRRRRPKRAL